MKFNAKLNILFKSLTLKNSVVSQIADVDASLISRFRSGIRTPKPDSPQLDKLCSGIITFASENNKVNIINSVCGFPSDMADAVLLSALKVWLLNTQDSANADIALNAEDSSPKYLKNFGTKLDSVMELLDLSNISLAKTLNVDPSLVSRFRNGSRTPSTRNQSIREICAYLYNTAESQKKLNSLYKLTGLNPAHLNNDREPIINYLADWISDRKEISEHTAVSAFLNNLNWMTCNDVTFPELSDLVPSAIENDPTTVYYGLEGFRNAFLKLCARGLKSDKADLVYVYTDQDLEWIHKEKGFIDKIVLLLLNALSVKKKNIKLIHSMNHTPQDVFFEIERLLPLHATGNIDSYYLSEGQSRYFSETLFIIPGVGAIVANLVIGTEDVGEYYYIEGDRIEYYQKQFEALLVNCQPLLVTIPKEDDEIHSELVDIETAPGSRISLQYSLPLDGLSEDTFKDMLDINNTELDFAKQANKIFAERQRENLSKYKQKVTEYVPLASISSIPSKEKMQSTSIDQLLNDPNYLMVPLNLGTIVSGKAQQIYYTREAYIEHVRALIKVLEKHDNYNFVPIEFKPFRNLRLMLVEGRCVIACSNASPIATFLFNHSLLNNLFEEYIYSLQNKRYKQKLTKHDSIKLLEDYVKFW